MIEQHNVILPVMMPVRLARPNEYLTGIYFAYLLGERLKPGGGSGYLGWTGREVRKRIAEHRDEGRPLDLAWVLQRGMKPEEGDLHNRVSLWRHDGESSIYKTNGKFWREFLRFSRGKRLEIILVPRDDVAGGQGNLFGVPPM
jgi:hypothetical protein